MNKGNKNTGNGNEGNGNTGHGNIGSWNSGNKNTGNCNPGNRNAGHGNSGDGNFGHFNPGYDNTGNKNVGNDNTGNRNAGDGNEGDANTGSWNSGCRNSGSGNTGSWNSGDDNTGRYNTGNWNSGSGNTGSWNTGDGHVGFFNSQKPTIFVFDAPTDISAEIFVETDEYKVVCEIVASPCVWVPTCRMTAAEKETHGGHTDDGGYLKLLSKDEQNEKSQQNYDALTDAEKQIIQGLPNFDAKKFKICTGIEVCESEWQLPGGGSSEGPTDSNSSK